MRKGKTSLQTKSTAAVPVTDGTARWLSGDSGAHLILHVTLDRNPDDFTFHSKIFTCKVKDGETGATLARASVDLANYANIEESNANNSPRGQKDLERSYATKLEFVSDAKKGFFRGSGGSSLVSANFVVTAMDITPPPDASPSEKLAFRRKSERHLSLDEYVASDGDSDAASSLGPDEDVADDSQSESASVLGDESDAATPDRRRGKGGGSGFVRKNVSFVDDFGEDDDAEGTAAKQKTTIDGLSPADAAAESEGSGSDSSDDDETNASRTSLESDPSASRLRWARAAMALGVPPPSPPRSEATDSVDGDGSERDASKRKKSMLGLYTSPSKKNVGASALGVVAEVGAGSGLSKFRAAAKKIQAAGRFGGAFAASGDEGLGVSLLDELNAEPDVASVAKAETAANDTELTKRHRAAVDEAVNALKQNAMFAETFGSFESTRALASTLEAALFERTSDVELTWETEAASLRAEIERLRRSNEDAVEAMAMLDAGGRAEVEAEASFSGKEETSAPDGSSAEVSLSSPVKSFAKKHTAKEQEKAKTTPPGSPSALFQRAARVGPLEEEIERLTLESQKLKLEALSEKKLAAKAQAQALEATKSLQDARASIDASLAKKVDLKTSALRAELRTLQGDHDLLASAVATLTTERDAARADASAESARALQTVVDEKAFLVRERDEARAALDTSEKAFLKATESLEARAVETEELRSELASSREAMARAEGEAAAHVNDVVANLETTRASLESANAALAEKNAELASTRLKLETAERDAAAEKAVAEGSIGSLTAELADVKDRSIRWEASAKAEKASLEALRKSVAENDEALAKKAERVAAETAAREASFASTIESLRAELVTIETNSEQQKAARLETEARAERAEMAAAAAEARFIEARADLEAAEKKNTESLADARASFELESARVTSAHEREVADFTSKITTLESSAKDLEQQLASKDVAIGAARERAVAAEASIAAARVASERAEENASLAVKAEKDARLETARFKALANDADTKRANDAETAAAEIVALRARLEQALNSTVGKVDAESLRDAEATLGEALAQRDAALENVLAAKRELEIFKDQMDTRWSDARVKAAAEKEAVQNKLDDALRKYETLRNVEAELVEWRRRAAEAEAELDAKDAARDRDVEAACSETEAKFKARLDERLQQLESAKRELLVEKEKHEASRAEIEETVNALQRADAERDAARRAVDSERARFAEAERAAGETTERARVVSEEAERRVAEAVARARDAERRAKDAEEKRETLASRLAETLAAAETAERASDATDESRDELFLLRERVDAAERRASVSEAEKADADARRLDATRALDEAEARAGAAASAAASADAEAQTQRAAAAAAVAKYEDALARFEIEMAAKDDVVERTRARLAEARGRLARLSRGGDSARGDDSTRGGDAYVGLEPPDVDNSRVSRESSSLSFGGGYGSKSPAKGSDLPWNYGAKDARTPRSSSRSSVSRNENEKDPMNAMISVSETRKSVSETHTPYGQTVSIVAASAVAAAATARVSSAGGHLSARTEKEKEKPHWASPSREYVKSRSGVDAFATPFAKAKPEHVVLAAADAAFEIKRLREEIAERKAETERFKRELMDSREHARSAARLAKEESERRSNAETKRVRDALRNADSELLKTRAELRAATNALKKTDSALQKERLSSETKVRETRDLSLRESASKARVAASRALEAEADRERLVNEAKRVAENALAESVRLRDALKEARGSLDASEEERFELRRALEAHVGALVEAKVDEAETKGELEAMREDVDDMRRRYEAAATRVVELETRNRRARDSKNFERLVGGTKTKTPPLRSPRTSDVSAASSFLAFSDDADMDGLPETIGDKTSSRRVSVGSARTKETLSAHGTGTHHHPKRPGRASSPHRRSSSPLRRGGSPRSSRRSTGSDDAAPGFTEKIDVD
jgi:chromosome segregation ATPase